MICEPFLLHIFRLSRNRLSNCSIDGLYAVCSYAGGRGLAFSLKGGVSTARMRRGRGKWEDIRYIIYQFLSFSLRNCIFVRNRCTSDIFYNFFHWAKPGIVQYTCKANKCILVYKALRYRARICKRLRSPKIDSKESIPPAFVAWRAGTISLFVVAARHASYLGWRNRFLGIDSWAPQMFTNKGSVLIK